MALRVNNNVAALNAYRNLTVSDSQQSKQLEKLSSGFRINRAADDAAGLSISEGLRSQVGGLKVAVRNAQDGISLVQTAEGALTETHALLQRVRDLSVQAANTGANDFTAREAASKEVEQALSEIDRISKSTRFGGKDLLNGASSPFNFQVGSDADAATNQVSVNIGSMGKTGLKLEESLTATKAGVTSTVTNANLATANAVVGPAANKVIGAGAAPTAITAGAETLSISVGGAAAENIDLTVAAGPLTADQVATDINTKIAANSNLTAAGVKATVEDGKIVLSDSNQSLVVTGDGATAVFGAATNSSTLVAANNTLSIEVDGAGPVELTLDEKVYNGTGGKDVAQIVSDINAKITANSALSGKVSAVVDGTTFKIESAEKGTASSVKLGGTSLTELGLGTTKATGTGDSDLAALVKAGSSDAITRADTAIKAVSSQRAELGAYQNRLEHTIANLSVTAENLSASESRIRDADMAQEMLGFTRAQILSQAGTAMLAQANQSSQGVLSLLR